MGPARNKFGFRCKQQKKSNTTTDLKAPKKLSNNKRKTVVFRASRSKCLRWADRWDVNFQEGVEENPIIIDDDFRIKVEPELEIKEEEDGGADGAIAQGRVVSRTAPYIPALRNPGTSRGFASMTEEELERHDFRDSHGARERHKAPRPNPYARGYPVVRNRAAAADMDDSEDPELIEVDDESWIEQDEHDYRWVEDDPDEGEKRPSSKPSIPMAPSPVSPNRVQLFQDTFRRLVFLGSDSVIGIAHAINMWLSHSVRFHIDEATAAFEDLEGQGMIRVHAGKVSVQRPVCLARFDQDELRLSLEAQTPSGFMSGHLTVVEHLDKLRRRTTTPHSRPANRSCVTENSLLPLPQVLVSQRRLNITSASVIFSLTPSTITPLLHIPRNTLPLNIGFVTIKPAIPKPTPTSYPDNMTNKSAARDMGKVLKSALKKPQGQHESPTARKDELRVSFDDPQNMVHEINTNIPVSEVKMYEQCARDVKEHDRRERAVRRAEAAFMAVTAPQA
ncbi:hypothetical protein BKA63DRAFT_587448 [Paraphoma chrysanthemicola]|nr:hypothetical protein BKA63DRAFT_587448 [Paraphoma chrysanthemicola]